MSLHPTWEALRRRRMADGVRPLYELTLAEARAADLAAVRAGAGRGEPVADVAELTCAGRPVRVYRPAADGPLPTVLYLFGGGWTLGSIDTADAVARRLANRTPAVVVVPGYRLAPEHPFPAAVDDAYAALCFAHDTYGGPLVVAGDSAGGNLAAAVALLSRDRGGPPLTGQALVYPNTDQTAALPDAHDPYLFNATSVAWYRDHYLPGPAAAADPRASPALAADHRALPPALIVTAGHDPLREQGERYAELLAAAGVPVAVHRYPAMAHGFFTMTGVLDEAAQAQDEIAAAVRRWCR